MQIRSLFSHSLCRIDRHAYTVHLAITQASRAPDMTFLVGPVYTDTSTRKG